MTWITIPHNSGTFNILWPEVAGQNDAFNIIVNYEILKLVTHLLKMNASKFLSVQLRSSLL